MNYFTLLSIFGDGEQGYITAKAMLGVLIIGFFVFMLVLIAKRLGTFKGVSPTNSHLVMDRYVRRTEHRRSSLDYMKNDYRYRDSIRELEELRDMKSLDDKRKLNI